MSIKLQNVSYVYGKGTSDEKIALDDVTLEIGDHEFMAIVGHTGSGKSTLIQMFNGLEQPTSGSIFYQGRDINEKGFSKKELRAKVGLVFQYPEHQLFESTVIKDVQFGPKNMGWDPLEVELNAFQALKDVGIGDDLLDVSPLALSGGQKRRVAIAGVLAMKPEILVLDEPMAGLDPAGRSEIFQLLQKIYTQRNITIVLVSHSMDDVAEYAQRMIVMNQGKVVLDGVPRKVFQYEEELKKIGLGIPQATSFVHQMAKRGAKIRQDCITVEETIDAVEEWLKQKKRGVL